MKFNFFLHFFIKEVKNICAMYVTVPRLCIVYTHWVYFCAKGRNEENGRKCIDKCTQWVYNKGTTKGHRPNNERKKIMKYTYEQLLNHMERMGNNLADVALGRMMDIVEEQTGTWPNWSDIAPDWVVRNCIGQ